jgi:hypothetical protein
MDAETVRAMLLRNLGRAANDPVGSHDMYDNDAVLEFPQSGERFEGVANIREWRTGERPIHTVLLAAQIPIVEHLRGLDELCGRSFTFVALPPAIQGMGTFPWYAQSPSSDQAEPSTRRNPLGEVPTERAGSARRVGNCTCRSPARHRAAARAEEPTTVRARWRGWGPGLDAPRADASGETGQVNPDTHHDGPRSPATR